MVGDQIPLNLSGLGHGCYAPFPSILLSMIDSEELYTRRSW